MLYFLGIDLGQRQDPTALALLQKLEYRDAYGRTGFSGLAVVGLERVPLGTPYPVVVERVARLTTRLELLRRTKVVVDATGVGAPVVEALRRAGLQADVAAVTITGGETARASGLDFHAPKQDLLAGLQLALEKGELKIARELKDAGALVKELVNMQVRPGARGRTMLGAAACGEHDDLVMATALAVWLGKRKPIGLGAQRLPGI